MPTCDTVVASRHGVLFYISRYLAVQYHLSLAVVPGKDEAHHQNLCSSTYPSLLSRQRYQWQYSLINSSTNSVKETHSNIVANHLCIKTNAEQLYTSKQTCKTAYTYS